MRLRIVLEILRKELTETLRDRRTLLMMVALPVLLYPLLMIGFSKLQVSQREATEERHLAHRALGRGARRPSRGHHARRQGRYPWRRHAPDAVRRGLERGTLTRPAPRRAGNDGREPHEPRARCRARRRVRAPTIDAVLVSGRTSGTALADLGVGNVSIYFDSVREDSLEAQSRLETRLDAFRTDSWRRASARWASPGLRARPRHPVDRTSRPRRGDPDRSSASSCRSCS